jgi:hypothetical protein
MDDQQIADRIEQLEDEERRLRAEESAAGAAGHRDEATLAADAGRLAAIKVELAQRGDLQRRRRALADAGRNPDEAELRDPGTVEGYLG